MILLTGGLGFIGSHTCVSLVEKGHEVILVDNLYNCKIEVLDNLRNLVDHPDRIHFHQGDVGDPVFLSRVFATYSITAVIHFASLKSVSESIAEPLRYYETNLGILWTLLHVMEKFNCRKIIFSSSSTVYGARADVPFTETCLTGNYLTCPYAQTKYFQEEMLKSYCASKDWTVIILRYFNPAGAHSSGLLGEDPNDTPNNLIPYILKVAVGKMPCLEIYGNDYETHDGFCVRDFIHVMDVAEGHVVALDKIQEDGIHIYNLGTGKGTSVMELVETFQKTNGIDISFKICPRRPGDVAESYADVSKAERQLGWTAIRTPQDICRDAYFYVLQSNRKGI